MSPRKVAQKTAKSGKAPAKKTSEVWTDVEREVMQDHARTMRRERSGQAEGEKDLLAKIAEMSEPDRGMATRIHAIVQASAPALSPKTWYGMPAYANEEGKVVCFFQNAQKFKARYATFGFSDTAKLDDGDLWPTSFALKKLTPAAEKTIAALVTKAVR